MSRHGIAADAAFDMLVKESQHRNVKLHVVAAEHVARHHV
jgi:AmiR/NasT family two-component response regulator